MALIKCPNCGKQVSDTCETCIHCGFDLASLTNKRETIISEDEEVIAKRNRETPQKFQSKTTSYKVLTYVLLIAGGLTAIVIALIIDCLPVIYISLPIIIVVSFILLFIGTVRTIIIKGNTESKFECMTYNKKKNKIILYPVTGAIGELDASEFTIDPNKEFPEDQPLVISYINDKTKKKTFYNLGFCLNPADAFKRINEIKLENQKKI